MTVTLELRPELEQRIAVEARARGLTIEAYLTAVIEEATLPATPHGSTLEQFEADMDALAEGSDQLPVLPPEAFTREVIYADQD